MNIEALVMKTLRLFSAPATHLLALGIAFITVAHAQEADRLPNYAPVLPQIKARALVVDPQKGYLVTQVKPDVYVITDGIYQSAFVTTGKGGILFDAPGAFARHIVTAGSPKSTPARPTSFRSRFMASRSARSWSTPRECRSRPARAITACS